MVPDCAPCLIPSSRFHWRKHVLLPTRDPTCRPSRLHRYRPAEDPLARQGLGSAPGVAGSQRARFVLPAKAVAGAGMGSEMSLQAGTLAAQTPGRSLRLFGLLSRILGHQFDPRPLNRLRNLLRRCAGLEVEADHTAWLFGCISHCHCLSCCVVGSHRSVFPPPDATALPSRRASRGSDFFHGREQIAGATPSRPRNQRLAPRRP
jgi:hypothetical protein